MKDSLRPVLCLTLLLLLTLPDGRVSHAADTSAPETLPMLHAHATREPSTSAAITWSPVEVECPICKTKNIFMQWSTYGSYIYQWPEKYQLVFWPYTDGAAWYSCKKCRLTAFMSDFKEIPAEKIPELRKALEDAKLPPQKERSEKESREHPPYLEIPTAARLVVAEKVYRALGRTDDHFWSHFYRVMGYHFDQDGKQTDADEARRKALALTERFLADEANEGVRKEMLYISGALKHFLRDDAGSLRDFEEAKKLTYAAKEIEPEKNEGYNAYISKLIDEYLEMLRKGKGPREKATGDGH